MSSKEFENRTALVTGGSRGIGRAVCLALAESGARVAINYTSDEKAAAATLVDVETRGARAMLVNADVSDAVESLFTHGTNWTPLLIGNTVPYGAGAQTRIQTS